MFHLLFANPSINPRNVFSQLRQHLKTSVGASSLTVTSHAVKGQVLPPACLSVCLSGCLLPVCPAVYRLSVLSPRSDSSRPSDSEVELKFEQCRRYLELNERLQEARGKLLRQREELRAVGERLDRDMAEVKGQPL